MALEDYIEPEVGVAVAVTAAVSSAVASPKVRGVLRRGAVYGLAGVLMAGDALVAMGRGIKRGTQAAVAEVPASETESGPAAGVPAVDTSEADVPENEALEAPHKRTRKVTEAAANG